MEETRCYCMKEETGHIHSGIVEMCFHPQHSPLPSPHSPLMGRFDLNGLVHMCFRQWELSLEGLTKAHSGLGRTEWGTTGYMCQSRQFVSAWPLPCNPLPLETCHLSLCNESFPLYTQLCIHSTARVLCCVLNKACLLHVQTCKAGCPKAVCMPCYMNRDRSD